MKKIVAILFNITTLVAFAQVDSTTNQNTYTNRAATKRVLIEEGTGTGCVACPWGIVRLDELHKKYPSTAAIASVHVKVYTKDPMEDLVYEAGITSKLGEGVPSAFVDRKQQTGIDPDQFEAEYLKQMAYVPAIDIFIDKISFNPVTRLLSFNVNAKTVTDFNGTYRFNAAITEMQVHGTTSDYDQQNGYSGDAPGSMGGFETKPDPVPAADMYYDFVGRTILGGWDGTANSIPATNASGQTISYTYTKTIPAEWNEKNLSIIGFVINSADGSVENASLSTKLDAVITGIDDQEKETVVAYPNPTSGIILLKDACEMDITVFDLTGMQVLKKLKNTTQINLSDFPNGVYFLQFNNGKQQYTKKITLIK